MRHLFVPFIILMISACGNKKEAENAEVPKADYTKVIEYAVDAGGMFHTDLEDDDFSDVTALMVNLLNDVLAGKLKAFDPITEQPLDLAAVRAKLFVTDTVYYEHPETGALTVEARTRDFGKQFYSVKFREQWLYDPNGAIIERKLIGLAPRIPVLSSEGELLGHTSLFWVKVK
jgi:hypothetical protein